MIVLERSPSDPALVLLPRGDMSLGVSLRNRSVTGAAGSRSRAGTDGADSRGDRC